MTDASVELSINEVKLFDFNTVSLSSALVQEIRAQMLIYIERSEGVRIS